MQPERPEGDDCPPWAGGPSARTRRRPALAVAALILGLCGLAGSVVGLATQLGPRNFTAAQQRQIMAWEMARRWRVTPAGKMFPAAVTYQLSGLALNSASQLPETARRLGIARQDGCAAATDRTAGQILGRLGCRAVLRATYADSTGSMIVTVGVAVLPDSAAASTAARELSGDGGSPGDGRLGPGLRPAPFAGTLAAGFGSRQRQLARDLSDGPYLILSTAGYADGRPRVRVSSDGYADQEMRSLAEGVGQAVGAPLGAPPVLPRCPGAPGC